jgi:hypothetical protein
MRPCFLGNTVNYGADYITRRLGTNHVGARGTLTIPIGYDFWTADGSSSILVNVTVHFTDDRSNEITGIVQWTVL